MAASDIAASTGPRSPSCLSGSSITSLVLYLGVGQRGPELDGLQLHVVRLCAYSAAPVSVKDGAHVRLAGTCSTRSRW